MASYKNHGDLKRGQFFTSLTRIQKAMAHKVGFRLVKPSIKEIRGAMKILMKSHMVGTMKVTHGQVITIVNYDLYQNPENYEGHSEGHTEGTIPTRKDSKKGKTPVDFSELLIRYNPIQRELIERAFKAITTTRKTGKVSDSILFAQLKAWEKYSPEKIECAIQTYLEKSCHLEGKDERYLLGIIRNQRAPLPLKNKCEEENPLLARRREMESVDPIPCPAEIKPDFVKERET